MRSWNEHEFSTENLYFWEFAIYQWGVETRKNRFGKVGLFFRFAIYQWGVETSKCNITSRLLSICSQFTNEELKHFFNFFYLFCKLNVRNLPMRSWNIYQHLCSLQQLLSSQFTNEELKQYFHIDMPTLIFRSQFTNEELKLSEWIFSHSFDFSFAIYQWGVERLNFKSYGFGLGKNL